MPSHIARGNATREQVRARVELVIPVLAALMLAVIGVAGRHMILSGNAEHSALQLAVVFAAQKHGMRLVIRTVGQFRAAAKIALANLTYNMRRLVWMETSASTV